MSLPTITIAGKKITCTPYVIRTLQCSDRKRKAELFRQWPQLRAWTPNIKPKLSGKDRLAA